MKRDPLHRWKTLEEGASQVKKGDLQSALKYLSHALANFRKADPQKDPGGYAVYRMAFALRDSLKDVTALAPMNLDDFKGLDTALDFKTLDELADFKIPDPGPLVIADDKTCPMCGKPKKP